MSRKAEAAVKNTHAQVREWLDTLGVAKVRALASQHKLSDWQTADVVKLRDELMVLPEVAEQAALFAV